MTEYWFYHLETSSLEAVLPELLEKTRLKNWRSLIKCAASRTAELDSYLWTYRDDSFLPHGKDTDPQAEWQPILISSDATSTENRDCTFLLDGQDIDAPPEAKRVIIMINGLDRKAVAAARQQWAKLKAGDADLSYWQQTETGGWEKRA